jgi:predicted alpha-1,2-mannosidase
MPKWSLANREASTMVGDPADPFVASAYAFGARGFDAQKALSLMKLAATDPNAACQGHPLRPGLADYVAKGYCPLDAPGTPEGPASTTLEYAVADFTIAQLAAALGDDATHTAFMTRAASWKNVFDASLTANGFTGYLQPRDMAGTFHVTDVTTQNPADFTGTSGFVEGNATQYTLAVQHDVPGLITLLGGDAAFVSRLDTFFTQLNAGLEQPYFYVGNEPGFGTPWAYAFAGAPTKTSDVIHRALHEAFTTQPSGLPGNDDLGATSAWQAWSMIGMYPAIPGIGGVILTTPVFSKTTLTLAAGAQLVITTEGTGPYIGSLSINGTPSTSSWVDWSKLSNGGTIALTLASSPTTWGTAPADRPPTF